MANDDHDDSGNGLEALRNRAVRALGNNTAILAVQKVRSIIGPVDIPDSEAAAQAALDTLRDGRIPTPQQITALEIVIRLIRPVVFSRNGQLDDLPETTNKDLQPTALKDAWTDFRQKTRSIVGSIGRIEDGDKKQVGTGFVVKDGLVATNRHVLAVLTFGSDRLRQGGGRIVFSFEIDSTIEKSDIADILGVEHVHPTLDMVLLRVDTAGRQPLSFASTFPAPGDRVATVGYPAEDIANNPLFLARVFNGKYGVRRASLGEVRDGSASPMIYHDCSTTQGNSGSPVFSISSGTVVGIHKSGRFMYRNEAITSDELQKLI